MEKGLHVKFNHLWEWVSKGNICGQKFKGFCPVTKGFLCEVRETGPREKLRGCKYRDKCLKEGSNGF